MLRPPGSSSPTTTGQLRVIGASTEQVQLLELFQIQNDEGPCLDCYHSGHVVAHAHLDGDSPWPQFAAECVLSRVPVRVCDPAPAKTVVLGCLNLFMASPVALSETEIALAQALGDVASIAIVQDQAIRDAAIREGHLQHALNSRIAIEQAKGMIAERKRIDMDEAFSRLRAYARNNNQGLTEIAEALVMGTLDVDAIGPPRRRPPPPSQPPGGPDAGSQRRRSGSSGRQPAASAEETASRSRAIDGDDAGDHVVVVANEGEQRVDGDDRSVPGHLAGHRAPAAGRPSARRAAAMSSSSTGRTTLSRVWPSTSTSVHP